MAISRRWFGMVAAVVLVSAAPAAATPNEDGQSATAASRYVATSPTGWMTTSAGDRVHDFAQIGNTVYVAGTFTGIQPTPSGPVTPQAHLAAFDATTGQPRSGFAPVLNGTVQSLEVAPDGSRLYASGEFTVVNGTTRNRVVALNPATGATLTGFSVNAGGGGVRSIVLRGSTLFLGGNFATVNGQTRTRLAAVDSTTGAVLAGFEATAASNVVLTLEMTSDGSRLYAGGRFTSVNGRAGTAYLAALDPATGAVQPAFTAQPGREVFDLLADGGLVWAALGGSLGRADVYRAADGTLLTRHETAGDVESVERVGGLIYFGGHDIGPSEVEHVGVVDPAAPAIMDAATFDEPTFGGDGTWAFHSTGNDLWVGGNVAGPYFGFARYRSAADPPPRVTLVPTLDTWRYRDNGADQGTAWRQPGFTDSAWPQGAAELGFGDGGEATVVQSGFGTYYFRRTFSVADVSTLTDLRVDLLDDDGAAVYVNGTEVVRHNLPTGTLTAASRAVTGRSGNDEDTFRGFTIPASALVNGSNTIAVEVHQNATSSTDLSFDLRLSAVLTAAAPVDVIARGAVWRYRDIGPAPAAAWTQPGYDDGTWLSGPAVLGREETSQATVLAPGAGSRWFRRSFPIGNAGGVSALSLDLIADDGAVVYLNGTEVVRDNMPSGPITPTTDAATYRQGTAERAVRTFAVAPSALVTGVNVLAVELHQAAGSPDASFDARLVATGATADTAPPSVPANLASPARTASTVDLTWSASTDDIGVERYEVVVNGASVGTTTTTAFTVTGLAAATSYSAQVEAIDAAGHRSGRSAPVTVTTTAAPPAPAELVALGSTWRYRNAGAAPPVDWTQAAFDDSTWLQGPAQLGREDGDEATVLTAGNGTRWFRRAFTVANAASVANLVFDVLADDGAVIYLNGTEVVRDNMPAGPITADTLAADYRVGVSETVRHQFTVPATALVDGVNVVAVEVHQASQSTDVSFDLRVSTA